MLRETANFTAEQTRKGVRITAKDRQSTPRARVVSQETWAILRTMNDSSFDGSCVLELGISTFRRT